MKIENTIKIIGLFYWLHSLILIVISFIYLSILQSSQSTLAKGLLIFHGFGLLLFTVPFARLGWNLWEIKKGASTQARNYSITLIILFIAFLPVNIDLLRARYFFLPIFLLHVLIIWRLSRQDIKETFEVIVENNDSINSN